MIRQHPEIFSSKRVFVKDEIYCQLIRLDKRRMTALIRVLLAPGETKAFGVLFLFSFKFFIRLAAVLPLLFIHANSVPRFQNTSNSLKQFDPGNLSHSYRRLFP